MADLATVKVFFENADAHNAFKARAAAALAEWAIAERGETAPSPVTDIWVARQEYARSVLGGGAAGVMRVAESMLPALAVKANDAGLLAEDGEISATDTQIRGTVDDAFVDLFADNVPGVG